MGQKTHPIGLRLGIIKNWNSRWFADRNFGRFLREDLTIRRYTAKRLQNAGLAKIDISRAPKRVTVDIHTSKPGIVIGRKGAEVDKLKEELQLLTQKEITINIVEVRKPELVAKLVAEGVARQLEGRISFRRAMKRSLSSSMKMGAEGVKIVCAGRLGGAEIARTEKYMEGRIPLHTLRADIDYAHATANTTYGTIGVKVWVCRGEVHDAGELITEAAQPADQMPGIEQRPEARRRERSERSDRSDRPPRRPRGGGGGGGGRRGGGKGAPRPEEG
jgi:small subunit ribosomal protein S3